MTSGARLYNDYVEECFGSARGARAWSVHGLYDPASNVGPFRYNNKIYRMAYALDMIPPAAHPGAMALDLGCGGGVYIPRLRNKGYDVTGIDISAEMIAASAELCRQLSVPADLRVGDCHATGLPADSFDVCVCVGLIEHQQIDAPLLEEVRRVLKPRGLLIVTLRNALCPHIRFRSSYRQRVHLRLVNWKRRLFAESPVGWDDMGWLRWDSRQHNPFTFADTLRAHGFDVGQKRFAHFYFLPEPLPAFFPRLEALVGKSMERLSSTPLGVLGSTVVISGRVAK